jgi:hypothetical protein
MHHRSWSVWVACLVLAGCEPSAELIAPDASVDGRACPVCDDGLFCNGVETCDPGDPRADEQGCVRPERGPCAGRCDEADDACPMSCETDEDGDGAIAVECGGNDCDDTDERRSPGAIEICDGDDEDCDPRTFGDRDSDADGYADSACCNGASCGSDCDDSRPDVHPTEAESCDGRDQDCDEAIDEGVLLTFVRDADEDGYGSAAAGAMRTSGCFAPKGYAASATDCDDANGAINPGNPERCEAARRDDDCDGTPNDGCACEEASTRACVDALGVCATGTQTCDVSGTWGACSVTPIAEGARACNGDDDDCDGIADDGLTYDCYPDADGDTFAAAGAISTARCPSSGACPPYETARPPATSSTDCDDSVANVFPGATESVCNGIDENCDGTPDDGLRLSFASVPSTGAVPPTCRDAECSLLQSAATCRSRTAADGSCPSLTGFGLSRTVRNSAGTITSYEYACSSYEPVPVTEAELRARVPGCFGSALGDAGNWCRAAADTICLERGTVGGTYVRSGTGYELACVPEGERLSVPIATLGAYYTDPVCGGATISSLDQDCDFLAAAAYCRDRVYAGGIGPVQWPTGPNVTIICFPRF